jgi:hypothetical protein
VNLVLVKFMVFPRPILDEPFLHRSLCGDDRRRVVVIEDCIQGIRLGDAHRRHLGAQETALMKKAVPLSSSSKYTSRVLATGSLLIPPNRRKVLF